MNLSTSPQFCLDVPATEAQQTECLVEVSREGNKKRKLKPRCQKLVEDRIKELPVAVKQLPVPEGLKGRKYRVRFTQGGSMQQIPWAGG